ncbi:ribbon-helix-helix protein, CopG family [Larkinella humicola]|uniref:Ribbon-helix-helix protein, CopG family n=1 Tax=Larkinella humicola TaxID=2607654 RepID=A0A5N1JAH8_9BACT|nr:ribbon-helix-helix protein, CopG family [Larkinella humicola]KAA9349405.1 ribbon-helix-helix protein, CopG family [Larkinella humicola]
MTTIQISLDDSHLTKLQEKAQAMNLPSVSELAKQIIEQVIDSDDSFRKETALSPERSALLDNIINENRELLQRLAQ